MYFEYIHPLFTLPSPLPQLWHFFLRWVLLVLPGLALGVAPDVVCGGLTRGHSVKDNGVPLPRSPQVPMTLQFTVGFHVHAPCWDFVWLELCQMAIPAVSACVQLSCWTWKTLSFVIYHGGSCSLPASSSAGSPSLGSGVGGMILGGMTQGEDDMGEDTESLFLSYLVLIFFILVIFMIIWGKLKTISHTCLLIS